MNSHQGLDRLDRALRIADEITVVIAGHEAPDQAIKQPRLMHDLPMRTAHGAEPVAIGEILDEVWIDAVLVLDDAVRNDGHGHR